MQYELDTVNVNVVVRWNDSDARLHTVLTRNVRLDLETNSSLTWITQPQFCRRYVTVRTYTDTAHYKLQLV